MGLPTVESFPMSEKLREEFNRWAVEGRGAELESHHRCFVEDTIRLMNVESRDRILEVGCGEGWTCRMLAERTSEGLVVGLDVSDEMVRNARAKSLSCENLLLLWASAEQIPWQDNFFSNGLAVECFYYFESPENALREIYRVLSPGGSLWIVNHLSKENELSLRWLDHLKVPVQLLSAEEYGGLFQQCGFENYEYRMIPDRTPIPERSSDPWFPDPEERRRFRERGALVMSVHKPTL